MQYLVSIVNFLFYPTSKSDFKHSPISDSSITIAIYGYPQNLDL